MRALFVRIYLALGLVWLLGVALAILVGRPDRVDDAQATLGALAEFPTAATAAMAAAEGREAEERAIDALAARFGHPVALVPRAAASVGLDDEERASLGRGETVATVTPSGIVVRVPLAAEPFLVELGPVPPSGRRGRRVSLVTLGALLVVAGGVTWLVRPLDQELRALGRAAEALGRGDLAVRADVRPDAPTGPLAATFNQMAERIGSLVRAREELLAAVSHELRGPLQRVRFALDLLPAVPSEALPDRVEALQDDVGELDDLVAELLTWSSLEVGGTALDLEPVDVAEVVTSVADDLTRSAPHLEVDVQPADTDSLLADRRLVRRAVGNLASNAARHAVGRVALTIRSEDAGVRVSVDDDGDGVPQEARERIFQPFVRLDAARARDTGGVGLGLAMVRRIVQSHGGTVDVRDSPLGGARFEIFLPHSGPNRPID